MGENRVGWGGGGGGDGNLNNEYLFFSWGGGFMVLTIILGAFLGGGGNGWATRRSKKPLWWEEEEDVCNLIFLIHLKRTRAGPFYLHPVFCTQRPFIENTSGRCSRWGAVVVILHHLREHEVGFFSLITVPLGKRRMPARLFSNARHGKNISNWKIGMI